MFLRQLSEGVGGREREGGERGDILGKVNHPGPFARRLSYWIVYCIAVVNTNAGFYGFQKVRHEAIFTGGTTRKQQRSD